MGLADIAKKLTVTAFNISGDIVEKIQYLRIVQDYDPDADDIEERIETYKSRMIPDNFTAEEITIGIGKRRENILPSDVKALIPGVEMPVLEPKPGDIIIRPTGKEWKVLDWEKSPADALYTLQLRKSVGDRGVVA